MNAKGHCESEAITTLNDALLDTVGLTWLDLGTMPQNWLDLLDADCYTRGAAALESEYGDAEVIRIKDPRVFRLLSFWQKVFSRKEHQLIFVFIHRPPGELADSLETGLNYPLEYGELLWLRYVLEAELQSREIQRIFISSTGLLSDWEGTIARVALELRLTLEQRDALGVEIENYLRGTLKHIGIVEGRPAAILPEVAEVSALLERWSTQGEKMFDYHELDERLQWLDSAKNVLLPLSKFAFEMSRQMEHMDTLLEQSKTDLKQSQDALNSHLIASRPQMEVMGSKPDELAELRANHTRLCQKLAVARRKPMRLLGDLWIYEFLKRLGAEASPLPPRMKARMMKSAAKRHPDRSLPEWRNDQAKSQASVSVKSKTQNPSPATRFMQRRPDLPDILLVSHDASRTGAPILVQNLGRIYKDRYNVTILCLRNGPLLSAFEDIAVCVREIPKGSLSSKEGRAKLKAFLKESDFVFAVVNSIQSRRVLGIMRKLKLPTVALLHEFASYTLPRSAFPEAIEHADTIIFSTSITMKNAIDLTGIGYNHKVQILPQGKCKVPSKTADSGPDWFERGRLKAMLKPEADDQGILVIGAGSVIIRKGTDLFIEAARRTLSQPGGEHFRFFWFGDGYNPDKDSAYSVYLQDQLRRAGIEDRVQIQPATTEIEYVYELADAFMLTSRLDPLPNVAIDAMLAGVPIVVFDKASGIPEILRAAGLEEDCVAEYLDTSQIAEKLRHVTGQDRIRVSSAMQAHARIVFDLEAYSEQIERRAMETIRYVAAQPQAEALIAKDPGFTPDFMRPVGQPNEGRDRDACAYLNIHSFGIHPRRPEPGFNQSVYYAYHNRSDLRLGDAYADYLSKGRPDGPWSIPILQGPLNDRSTSKVTGLRIALHIHAYYQDGLVDVLSRLKANLSRPKVFVSVKDAHALAEANALLQGYDGESEIRIVPNIGRDIAPFLTEFGPELVRDFDVIGHVHIKKSIALQNDSLVEYWMRFVLSNVLGGSQAGAMMDLQLSEFSRMPGLGMTFPADPHILSWNKNRTHAELLAAKMGIIDLPDAFDFPVGTMFWIRNDALAPFIGLNLKWADYPHEPLPCDGTMLHALERLFGIIPKLNGFETRMTNVTGVTR